MDLSDRLGDLKAALRVTHDRDDGLLTKLLDAAGDEYLEFTGIDEESDSSATLPNTAWQGIVVMVQADYDADPVERAAYRAAAETLWMPHRKGLGV